MSQTNEGARRAPSFSRIVGGRPFVGRRGERCTIVFFEVRATDFGVAIIVNGMEVARAAGMSRKQAVRAAVAAKRQWAAPTARPAVLIDLDSIVAALAGGAIR